MLEPSKPSAEIDDAEPTERGNATRGEDGEASASAPLVGATLGRYRVLEELGAGAMGVVYAAYDPRLDRRVALKVMHAGLEGSSAGSTGPDRLVREAQSLAKLAHPNVVAVHDAGVVDGRAYVTMELVAGVTLREWLRQTERTWRDGLAKMLVAGRGLAAAHAAGLVHRDFKPDNVIIGDDGRVRVLDFGLARASGHREVLASTPDDETSSREHLTRTGALLGTPAYMAPEQFLGGTIDARTDQFAFCVTLWEVLYGERPFRARGIGSLGLQITRDDPPEPPPQRGVPASIHQLILRGLAKAPDDRHPNIDALLAAIEAELHPDARRGRSAMLFGLAGLALVGAFAVMSEREEPPCRGAADRLAEVWGTPQRDAIASAFAATELSIAADTSARVDDALSAWGDRWVAHHTEACEATHVRHEQSDALFDQRMRCLERQRQHFSAFVDLLARADAALVYRAVGAVEDLPNLAACDDLDALARTTPPPSDPHDAARVVELQDDVDRVRALVQAGRFAEARDRAHAIADEAKRVAYPPVEAEALYAAAIAHVSLKELEPASTAALDSLAAALASGDPHGIAHSLLTHCRVAAMSSKLDEARTCIAMAEGAARRIPNDTTIAAQVRQAAGIVAIERGERDEGLAALRESVALVEASEGEGSGLAHVLHNYGDSCRSIGRFDEAETMLARAVAMRERFLGENHPDVAFSLNSLAIVHIEQKRFDEAFSELDRVLALRKLAFGDEHDHVAATYNNIGIAYSKAGRCSDAIAPFERGLSLRIRGLGDDHFKVAAMRATLAACKLELGDLEAARALAERALVGLADPQLAAERCEASETLARVREREGDAEAARAARAGCPPAK